MSEETAGTVILKSGREKSLKRRHPWIFSGAVETVKGNPEKGDTVLVRSSSGELMGTGAFSPDSQIRVRMWSFDGGTLPGEELFRGIIAKAMQYREAVFTELPDAFRVVNAESDGFPGLIVDRYRDFLVCQFLTAGAERWKGTITSVLDELLKPSGIYERSDADIRGKEGLEVSCGLIRGEEPPEFITISEHGCRFLVDVRNGHKTGFYLDQRENRALSSFPAKDGTVLNCFSYTGGFCIPVLKGGAEKVTNIDSSADALGLLLRNAEINGLDQDRIENIEGDVFTVLRKFRDQARFFSMIILDPPKFVNSMNGFDKACRAYKDINLLALKLLIPGGVLFTFSCSGLLSAELFRKIVFDASVDAGRDVMVARQLFQSPDHPLSLNFPEGLYLKGLLCSVK